MTRDLSTAPEGEQDLGPVNNMRRAIRNDERGDEVDIVSFLNFHAIQPGKTLRVYRLADRDVAKGKPALLEMHIRTVDAAHGLFTFSGTYQSTKQNLKIKNGSCIIHPNGTITISPDQKAMHIVRTSTQMCLIFEDEREFDIDSTEASTVHDLRNDLHDGLESTGATGN